MRLGGEWGNSAQGRKTPFVDNSLSFEFALRNKRHSMCEYTNHTFTVFTYKHINIDAVLIQDDSSNIF